MRVDRLVTMANDIGAFWAAEPDKTEAAKNVASHLKRFWDPRMRREIAAHLQSGGAGLSPTAKSAVQLLTNSPNQSK
jgi:formate dehydrogenase subunit delta